MLLGAAVPAAAAEGPRTTKAQAATAAIPAAAVPYSYTEPVSTDGGDFDPLYPRIGMDDGGNVAFPAAHAPAKAEIDRSIPSSDAIQQLAIPGPHAATTQVLSPGFDTNASGTTAVVVHNTSSGQPVLDTLATLAPSTGTPTVLAEGGAGEVFSRIESNAS